jgi:hypothetical protein
VYNKKAPKTYIQKQYEMAGSFLPKTKTKSKFLKHQMEGGHFTARDGPS